MRQRPVPHRPAPGAVSVAAIVALLALLLAGCGDEPAGEEPEPSPATGSPSPTLPPAPDATAGEGAEPVGTGGTAEVTAGDFPSGGGEVALLEDVRVAAHDGFDRIVWEFAGEDVPSYRIRYVEPPVREDGSGNEVEVAGEAFLEVSLTPASGVDLSGEDYRETYEGPRRIDAPPGGVVAEVVRTGDFEAHLTWVVGVEREAPFAVAWLEQPLRLVVDVLRD